MDRGRDLERLLGAAEPAPVAAAATVPDLAHVYEELRRPGVALWLLWQEYRSRRVAADVSSRR